MTEENTSNVHFSQEISDENAVQKQSSQIEDSIPGMDELEELPFNMNLPISYFRGLFDEMDDDEFLQVIENVNQEYSELILENEIFIMHLMSNEPLMLQNLEQAKTKIKRLEEIMHVFPHFFKEVPEEILAADTVQFAEGVKINLSQRSELVSRFIDEYKVDAMDFKQKSDKLRVRLTAEIEESKIRLEETINQLLEFEHNVVIGGVDPITQRIPAEKFILHLNTQMKAARGITEKIRLNIAYDKVTYKKLKAIHEQKVDLGESITNVAFEELYIANNSLCKKGEVQCRNIFKLKVMNGDGNREVSSSKKALFHLEKQFRQLVRDILACDDQVTTFCKENKKTEEVIFRERTAYFNVKKIVERCEGPAAVDYLRVKHREHELLEAHKVLKREENIVNLTRKGLEVNLLHVTHRKTVNPKWYTPLSKSDALELDNALSGRLNTAKDIDPQYDIFQVLHIQPLSSAESCK